MSFSWSQRIQPHTSIWWIKIVPKLPINVSLQALENWRTIFIIQTTSQINYEQILFRSSPILKTHPSNSRVFWKLISLILKTHQPSWWVGLFWKLISPILKTHQSNSRVRVFWKLISPILGSFLDITTFSRHSPLQEGGLSWSKLRTIGSFTLISLVEYCHVSVISQA